MFVRSCGVWFGFAENMFMFQQLLALVSTALRLRNIKYLILMLEICIITVIVKGHVYCWKYHPCINYYNIFRLYIGMRIYISELKGVPFSTFEAHLFSSNFEHCSISSVNSYQCSYKQCCPIAAYAMCVCYSLINLCGYWT